MYGKVAIVLQIVLLVKRRIKGLPPWARLRQAERMLGMEVTGAEGEATSSLCLAVLIPPFDGIDSKCQGLPSAALQSLRDF